jgi:hypothetical protein
VRFITVREKAARRSIMQHTGCLAESAEAVCPEHASSTLSHALPDRAERQAQEFCRLSLPWVPLTIALMLLLGWGNLLLTWVALCNR